MIIILDIEDYKPVEKYNFSHKKKHLLKNKHFLDSTLLPPFAL